MVNIIEKSEVNNVIGGLLAKAKDKGKINTTIDKYKADKENSEKPGKGGK